MTRVSHAHQPCPACKVTLAAAEVPGDDPNPPLSNTNTVCGACGAVLWYDLTGTLNAMSKERWRLLSRSEHRRLYTTQQIVNLHRAQATPPGPQGPKHSPQHKTKRVFDN